jgi:hypothetical protein
MKFVILIASDVIRSVRDKGAVNHKGFGQIPEQLYIDYFFRFDISLIFLPILVRLV